MAEFRILITGSRYWKDLKAVESAIVDAIDEAGAMGGDIVIVHGDCFSGADAIADQIGRHLEFTVEDHPADWALGRAAGPIRNQKMVDLGADVCLAFPLPNSIGTLDCMRRATKAGIPIENHGTI